MAAVESRATGFTLFLGAAGLAVCYYVLLSQWPLMGVWEAVAIAESLVDQGSFANPFPGTLMTGSTAHLAPLYPAFLAGLLKIFGTNVAIASWIAAVVFIGLHTAVLPRLSRVLYGDGAPGLYAAALAAALPVFRIAPSADAVPSALALMLFCAVSAWAVQRNRRILGRVAGAGVVAGLTLLLNPASAGLILPWMAYLLVRARFPLAKAVRAGSAFTLALVLTCLPWTLRNYHRLGAVLFVRSNLGLELQVSNNNCAVFTQTQNTFTGCTTQTHPQYSLAQAREMRALGEVEYNRRKMSQALAWISRRPASCLRLTLRRIFYFWFPHPEFGPYAYSIWLVTALSFAGLALMMARRTPAAAAVLAVWLVFPLIYYVVQSDPRYRYPILWLSLLCAGYALRALAAKVGARRAARCAAATE